MPQEKEFVEIIQKNESILYKMMRLYADTKEDQKDLYQEIVYQLWKGFNTFRSDAKVSTWIYRIALNTALLHLKNKKRKGHKTSLAGIVLVAENYDPILEERIKTLYTSIKTLGEVDKGIIFLFLEGKKYEEIAAITGISASNVGTRMARIKEKLNKKIIKK
ncbi:RNA polymerase sigma factor [Leeuwenhoekiella marinoflava]|uniref:RNA polymerase sigma-70 factor (ECF subfamily) n=2 Tax=Leeuwenhoekiella marinoflava TaxID=988 RepID=A0A4Q0PPE3_9FLAO|nr:sigma-70 family RNA polymerase sigma factor [Leeuwenhoekiella marinoflava]RXG32341.1 RNA polymerase sigma-70 factor (ECF subfamily) [Leeuwenhoekiella marinoflava]SHE78501.1 RNA polymerase sigma-70 factor, ECF subfamily [Leeuwenhoekiella marinoflava DSM 3653]